MKKSDFKFSNPILLKTNFLVNKEFKNNENSLNNSGLRPFKNEKAFLVSDYLLQNSEELHK